MQTLSSALRPGILLNEELSVFAATSAPIVFSMMRIVCVVSVDTFRNLLKIVIVSPGFPRLGSAIYREWIILTDEA